MEHLKELLSYDPETGLLIWKIGRGNQFSKKGGYAGSDHNSGYKVIQVSGKQYIYHRVCWFLHYGELSVKQIDHINGDRKDNRIINLRVLTNRENASNRDVHRAGKLVGACLNKRRNNWLSTIRVGNKNIFLCYCKTEQEAHEMYLLALKNLDKFNGNSSDFRSLLKKNQ